MQFRQSKQPFINLFKSMLNLKIKEPDYKQLYESRQAKIDSLNKTIVGLKSRNTKLENEVITLKRQLYQLR